MLVLDHHLEIVDNLFGLSVIEDYSEAGVLIGVGRNGWGHIANIDGLCSRSIVLGHHKLGKETSHSIPLGTDFNVF